MANRANINTLLITAAVLLGVVSIPAPADTIYVNADGTGDYPTIQASIDAASNGDEVVLMPGTYTGDGNRDLNFKAKAITVRSVNPDDDVCMHQTIIDPEGIGVIARFINDEGPDSIFEGFTIGAGDIYKSVQRGKPGFFEFSNNARPTTRRLRNKTCRPLSKLRPLSYDKSVPYPQDTDAPGRIPPAGLAWDGHNPFHQPANTTDYYGSGDVNNDGELTFADVLMAVDIANGTVPPVARADVDGDGDVDQSDAALIDTAYEGGSLPGWWNELTTVAQRNHWMDRVMAIDRTNEHWYSISFFVCHHFSYQTFIHAAFLRGDFATESTEYDGGQTVFNVPLYFVGVGGPISHAINGILVGDDPLDFNDWRFIEPQNDLTAHAGDWNIPYNSDVTIEPCNLYWNGEEMVEFHVEETGCTLTRSSDNLITTRPAPPEQEPDNRPDLWNPRIVPVGDSGVILYEKMREDLSRTTDIHITDLPFADPPVGTPLTMDSQFSRLLDVTKAQDGTIHLLSEGTDIFYRQTMFHGELDPVQCRLTNTAHVVQELRLPATGRLVVQPGGDIHAFWFENYGFAGSYDFGIHWAKCTTSGWQTPQKLTADAPQGADADWLNRHFARYVFDVEVLDNGDIILVWVEKVIGKFYITELMYDNAWSAPYRIEDTGWYGSARGVDLCKDSDGDIHLAYWRGDRQQPGGREEGRGDLYHRSFDGVSWSEPVLVDGTDGVCCPSIASGEDGEVYMIWERRIDPNNVIPVFSKYENGLWGRNFQLTVHPGADAWYPVVSRLGDDRIVAAWSSRSADRVTIETAMLDLNPLCLYVDADATGDNSGWNWANAFNHLQDALAYAASDGNINEIRVAQGLHLPDRDSARPNGSGNRNATFDLLNGITVKGGYAGFGEADPDARRPDLYKTILSGDLDANDVPISDAGDLKDGPTRFDNSFNVVTGSGTNASAVLEGFTITGGYANVEDSPDFITCCGGGMLNRSGSPTVRNCTFTGNLAAVFGGGMCNWEESNPMVSNCKFVGNYLGEYTHGNAGGGGMANNNSSPVLDNCSFIMNKTCHSGAGIYNYWSYPTLTNCIIEDNSTLNMWGDGGGMYNCGGSPALTNCIFKGNCATEWYGGGMYNQYQCEPYLANCTFVENTAYRDGGGIYNTDLSFAATMSNCIFWGNSDRGGTDESAQIEGGTVAVDHTCIQGWTGALGGTGNIGGNPQFVGGPQGDYYLSQLSAGQTTQSPCVDTGSHTAVALGLETFTTRTDEVGDEAMVDMGYHYCISGPVDANLSVGFDINETWMYQNVLGWTNSRLTAEVSITDDPLSNTSYTYDWEVILPDDVTIAPTITAGGGPSDPCCTFAAPSCNETGGVSDSGETFTVQVTVTGTDFGNTGIAEAQFGIALLGDVNNDGIVNVVDRSIINAFWRLGAAGPFTFRDCNINCDTAVNVADRSIANAVWRGVLGQNSVTSSCPLR